MDAKRRVRTPLKQKPKEASFAVATIVLRKNQLAKFCRLAGIKTDKELATRMHVDPATIHRTVKGDAAPGHKFIAGALEVFGIECFADLFEVHPSDDEGKDAA